MAVVQSISATSRDRGVDDRPEMLADELLGPEAGQALDRVETGT